MGFRYYSTCIQAARERGYQTAVDISGQAAPTPSCAARSWYFGHKQHRQNMSNRGDITSARYPSFYFFSFGLSINSGLTYLSKSSSLNAFSSIALSFSVNPFLCAFFATFDAISYPITGFRHVTSIRLTRPSVESSLALGKKQTYLSCKRLPILFSSAFNPSTRFLSKLFIASLKIRILCSRFRMITGLNTLSSNCPFIPPTVTAV